MSFVQSLCLVLSILSGVLLMLMFVFSKSDDTSILSGKVDQFTPGTFDSARNKIVAFFAICFVLSILLINVIAVRKSKSRLVFEGRDVTKKSVSSTEGGSDYE